VKHKIDFKYIDVQDDESIELVFSRKKVEDRKTWLGNFNPEIVMVYDRPKIRYK
jgi:DNA topoisomerase-2